MKKTKKVEKKKVKLWPKNLTADELREEMDEIEGQLDDCYGIQSQLEHEFERRKLKPKKS